MIKAIFFVYSILAAHPVHVSLTSVDYDEDAGRFSVFVKVYADDLENDCRIMAGDHDLILYKEGYMPDTILLRRYIDDKLVFTAGSRRLKGVIENIEADAEEVRIYLRYSYRGKSTEFRITNTIMTGLFADQTNLLIFRKGKFEEGFKFTPEITEVIIKPGKKS